VDITHDGSVSAFKSVSAFYIFSLFFSSRCRFSILFRYFFQVGLVVGYRTLNMAISVLGFGLLQILLHYISSNSIRERAYVESMYGIICKGIIHIKTLTFVLHMVFTNVRCKWGEKNTPKFNKEYLWNH